MNFILSFHFMCIYFSPFFINLPQIILSFFFFLLPIILLKMPNGVKFPISFQPPFLQNEILKGHLYSTIYTRLMGDTIISVAENDMKQTTIVGSPRALHRLSLILMIQLQRLNLKVFEKTG
uniref:Uncharacterized protein n=1 Tax=Cacopsylla melanoneura TaxID=428564 RepID=A0A8D8YKB5_9HEMI